MKIQTAKNPEWANAARCSINLIIDVPCLGELPFCASASDVEQHGRELFDRAINGEFGAIADPAPPPQEMVEMLAKIQAERDAKIEAKSDHVTQYITTHTPAEIKAWVKGKLPTLTDPEAAFISRLAVALGALYREQ